ncbi:hypothetical protein BGZ97_009500 [Linnemannia gamsii]|uniref:Uncharacterized protein n=1 Tax=Linnemannia gamsii TaxID=64522 RepID=A0A9P6UNN6_9FUNG|nr:hypothetical protein BGZ97_009500 [Linnemannia gamsii]
MAETLEPAPGHRSANPMVKPEAKLLHPERASQDPRTDMDSPPMKLLKGMCPEVDKSSLQFKDSKSQMVCGDKDDDGDNDVAHRAKRQKLVEENVGGGGGSGVTTILSQDMAMLKLEHLLALYEVDSSAYQGHAETIAGRSRLRRKAQLDYRSRRRPSRTSRFVIVYCGRVQQYFIIMY